MSMFLTGAGPIPGDFTAPKVAQTGGFSRQTGFADGFAAPLPVVQAKKFVFNQLN
jgi:hypothetical protein